MFPYHAYMMESRFSQPVEEPITMKDIIKYLKVTFLKLLVLFNGESVNEDVKLQSKGKKPSKSRSRRIKNQVSKPRSKSNKTSDNGRKGSGHKTVRRSSKYSKS